MHDIRFKKNISLQKLAKMTNIDIETLMKFESGEYSGLSILQYVKIAECLGVCLNEITKGIDFNIT